MNEHVTFKINEIHIIPLHFVEMCKLKLVKLDFSCNRITVIPTTFRFLTTLSDLVLDNNPLQSPPAQVRLIQLQYICWPVHVGIWNYLLFKDVILQCTVCCYFFTLFLLINLVIKVLYLPYYKLSSQTIRPWQPFY